MGEAWGFRHRFDQARTLMRAQDAWCAKASRGIAEMNGSAFPTDLELETMVGVLRGDVQINNHCYETGDLEMQLRNGEEFGFTIGAFHHALSAYLIPDALKAAPGNITIATFANLWGYKAEAFQGSPWAGKILTDAGVPLAYKSDHPVTDSSHLIYQSQIATHFDLSDEFAIKAVTSVPATSLGLGHRIGYVRAGYDADLVIWNDYPLELGAHPIQVFIDGVAQLEFEHEALTVFEPVVQETHTADVECTVGATNFVIEGITDDFTGSEVGSTLVMIDGQVACYGSSNECSAVIASTKDLPIVHIESASLVPGITTLAPGLGLIEIDAESSTADGDIDESKPLDPDSVITAADGVVYGGPHFDRAEKMGVVEAIVAPSGNFLQGISTAFRLSATSILDPSAIVKRQIAMNFKIGHDSKSTVSSISSQINTLRTILREGKGVYGSLANGSLPLVIEAHNADEMGHLILLKREFPDAYMIIKGATEAHKIAKELKDASIPVLMYPRCMPSTWRTRDCLPGPPMTRATTLSVLLKAGVEVGLIGNDDGNLGESFWEASWAAKLAAEDDVDLSPQHVIDLVSTNVRKILRLPKQNEFLVFQGSPLSLKSQVVLKVTDGAVRLCMPRV